MSDFIQLLSKQEKYLKENLMQLTKKEKTDFREDVKKFFTGLENDKQTYIIADFVWYLQGVNQYEVIADVIATKLGDIKNRHLIDVASGNHCRLSYELTKRGAIVTAIDPKAAPRRNNGFVVEKTKFDFARSYKEKTIVAVRPMNLIEGLMQVCIREKIPGILVPSMNRYEPHKDIGIEIKNFDDYLNYLTILYGKEFELKKFLIGEKEIMLFVKN